MSTMKIRVGEGVTGSYRPTTLALASRHCPRAIDFYNADTPTDRRIFGTGIAAHAVIQACIQTTNELERTLDDGELDAVSLGVCERMIREGRKFEGVQEPPLPADDVWAGRDLARAYVERHPIEPAELFSRAEVGMAVDEHWQPVDYTGGARLRLIADYVTVAEELDEETSARVLVVRDYKSAWSTYEKELSTVQRKAQAVMAWLHHGGDDVDCLRVEVVNLRTGATFTRDLWMLDDGLEVLQRWQDELGATMRALDAGREETTSPKRLKEMMIARREDLSFPFQVGERPGDPCTFDGEEIPSGRYAAAPGGGCIGCPYVPHCSPGREWRNKALEHSATDRAVAWSSIGTELRALGGMLKLKTDATLLSRAEDFSDRLEVLARELIAIDPLSAGDRATAYAVLQASLDSLRAVLADETDDDPVAIPGGKVVGTVAREERAAAEDAWQIVAEEWTSRGGDAAGMAKALGLGVAQLESVAKVLYPEREDISERRAWVESLTEPKISRRFGIHAEKDV